MNKAAFKLISAILTTVMIAPLSSKAIDPQASFNSDSLIKSLDGFTEIDSCDIFQWVDYDRVFMNEDATHIIGFHKLSDQIVFTMAGGVEQQEIAEFVKENYGSPIIITTNDFFGNYGEVFAVENADIKTQVSICDSLKEKGMITRGVNQYLTWYLKYEDGAPICEENGVPKKFSTIETLSDYIATEFDGYDVREIKDDKEKTIYIELVPPDGTTLHEQVEIAEKIAKDIQLSPYYESPESTQNIETAEIIDIFNGVMGDANCDGRVSVSDSVAILQNIGNKDKYPLSAQGKFNADTDFDGLTANDALIIQQWDSQGIL